MDSDGQVAAAEGEDARVDELLRMIDAGEEPGFDCPCAACAYSGGIGSADVAPGRCAACRHTLALLWWRAHRDSERLIVSPRNRDGGDGLEAPPAGACTIDKAEGLQGTDRVTLACRWCPRGPRGGLRIIRPRYRDLVDAYSQARTSGAAVLLHGDGAVEVRAGRLHTDWAPPRRIPAGTPSSPPGVFRPARREAAT